MKKKNLEKMKNEELKKKKKVYEMKNKEK